MGQLENTQAHVLILVKVDKCMQNYEANYLYITKLTWFRHIGYKSIGFTIFSLSILTTLFFSLTEFVFIMSTCYVQILLILNYWTLVYNSKVFPFESCYNVLQHSSNNSPNT